jgi:hypothetical protein
MLTPLLSAVLAETPFRVLTKELISTVRRDLPPLFSSRGSLYFILDDVHRLSVECWRIPMEALSIDSGVIGLRGGRSLLPVFVPSGLKTLKEARVKLWSEEICLQCRTTFPALTLPVM